MKFWVYALTALSALGLATPERAMAADLSGRLSAAVELRDSDEGGSETPFFLYAYANARKIGDVPGLNFRLYGRLVTEGGEEEEGSESSLYLAYLEKTNLVKGLDVKAGRQFAAISAGARTIDGVDLRYQGWAPFVLRALAGQTVAVDSDDATSATAAGLEARARLDSFEAALSAYRESKGSSTLKELYGADFRWELPWDTAAYGEVSYDSLREQLAHLYLEADYFAKNPVGARLHYLYDVPVFEATSIYSVFASDLYEEAGAEVTYRLGGGYTAVARYTREFYDSSPDADTVEGGVEKERGEGWSGYLVGTARRDEGGQSLSGVKALFAYPVCRYFEPGIGVHYDVLERRIEDTEDTTAKRFWVFAKSELSETLSFDALVEAGKSVLTGDYTLARLQANYRF